MFYKDLSKGKKLEQLFKEFFQNHENFKKCNLIDISEERLSYDFVATGGYFQDGCLIDCKSHRSNGMLPIEIGQNCDTKFGPYKEGWWYTSIAHIFVYVNKTDKTSHWLFMSDELKQFISTNSHKYKLHFNNISKRGYSSWRSCYKLIPIKDIREHVFSIDMTTGKQT